MIEEPVKRGAVLNLILTNKVGLVGNVKLTATLAAVTIMEFKIIKAVRRAPPKLTTMDFRREVFCLFGDLLGKVPWDKALEGRGTQEIWLILKDHLF